MGHRAYNKCASLKPGRNPATVQFVVTCSHMRIKPTGLALIVHSCMQPRLSAWATRRVDLAHVTRPRPSNVPLHHSGQLEGGQRHSVRRIKTRLRAREEAPLKVEDLKVLAGRKLRHCRVYMLDRRGDMNSVCLCEQLVPSSSPGSGSGATRRWWRRRPSPMRRRWPVRTQSWRNRPMRSWRNRSMRSRTRGGGAWRCRRHRHGRRRTGSRRHSRRHSRWHQ